MLLYSTETVIDIATDSTVSSSVMIVTFSYQLFAIRYNVTIEQCNTGGSGRQQKVISSNQTTLTTTFTTLSKFNIALSPIAASLFGAALHVLQ